MQEYKREYDGRNSIKISGRWTARLYGPDGNLKNEMQGSNVITENGIDFLASFLHSATTGASFDMVHIAIGTDSTSEAASNTALGTESSRHTGTASYTSNGIYEVVATFATGSGTGAITEYGLFSSNTGGTMWARKTESVINKGANDTLTVTAQITFT